MTISVDEVYETARMTLYQNFDIRTTTLGINLKDCVHSNFNTFKKRVYDRIRTHGARLLTEALKLESKYGIPIVNKRIAITPVSLIMETHATVPQYLAMAQTIDRAAKDAGISFIGGFGALVQKGLTKSDAVLVESLPDVLSKTERVCAFLNVGSNVAGMNMDAVLMIGPMLKKTAAMSKKAIGCAKFVVFVNAPEDNPFMAGAFHGVGEPDFTTSPNSPRSSKRLRLKLPGPANLSDASLPAILESPLGSLISLLRQPLRKAIRWHASSKASVLKR
jgi:uncharacterized protein (UPF0210 family)